MTEVRSTSCSSCHGHVSIPSRRRTITLEAVLAVHEHTCPGRGFKRPTTTTQETP